MQCKNADAYKSSASKEFMLGNHWYFKDDLNLNPMFVTNVMMYWLLMN